MSGLSSPQVMRAQMLSLTLLGGTCSRLRMGSREASSVRSAPDDAPSTLNVLLYEPVAMLSPRPLMQQSNLSKIESFSYRSHNWRTGDKGKGKGRTFTSGLSVMNWTWGQKQDRMCVAGCDSWCVMQSVKARLPKTSVLAQTVQKPIHQKHVSKPAAYELIQ